MNFRNGAALDDQVLGKELKMIHEYVNHRALKSCISQIRHLLPTESYGGTSTSMPTKKADPLIMQTIAFGHSAKLCLNEHDFRQTKHGFQSGGLFFALKNKRVRNHEVSIEWHWLLLVFDVGAIQQFSQMYVSKYAILLNVGMSHGPSACKCRISIYFIDYIQYIYHRFTSRTNQIEFHT